MAYKAIKDIELGPRQLLLFEFEHDTVGEQNQIMASVADHVEIHGWADLEDFVQMAVDSFSWSEFKILQHLFWLANDLKLHFRRNGENLSPAAAKKVLIESPEPGLHIVLNKPVDETVFRTVKDFFKQITPGAGCDDFRDQIEFARRLTREIRHWENTLESCRQRAQHDRLPGEKDIDACQKVIMKISTKLDAFSLIHTFFNSAGAITELTKTIKILSDFYSQQGDGWQILVRSAREFKKTEAEILKNPSAAAAYDRLNRILSSDRPYNRVNEAWQLMKTVKTCHEKIVAQLTQQCRNAALPSIHSLIEKMKNHLKAHEAPKDLCNRSLYALRAKIKCINAATTIHMINFYVSAAEEAFEVAWEDVLSKGQK